MITAYAVEFGGEIVAVFKSDFTAKHYAQEILGKGAIVHGWVIPAETFKFEGE